MSVASRRRQYCDRYLHGFATLAKFRAWQVTELLRWVPLPQREEWHQVWRHALGLPLPEDTPPVTYPTQDQLDALWAQEAAHA